MILVHKKVSCGFLVLLRSTCNSINLPLDEDVEPFLNRAYGVNEKSNYFVSFFPKNKLDSTQSMQLGIGYLSLIIR